jgi:hypothetical protein
MSEQEDKWIESVEEEKLKIQKMETKDRLASLAKITFMNGTLASSVTGWSQWLSNALILERLSEEELKELTVVFQDLVITFLDLDIKYTKIIRERKRKEEKETQASLKKRREEKSYIS